MPTLILCLKLAYYASIMLGALHPYYAYNHIACVIITVQLISNHTIIIAYSIATFTNHTLK